MYYIFIYKSLDCTELIKVKTAHSSVHMTTQTNTSTVPKPICLSTYLRELLHTLNKPS